MPPYSGMGMARRVNRRLLFLAPLLLIVLLAIPIDARASGPISDGSPTCDSTFGGFSCASSYDFNPTTVWASASGVFPHWVYVTFTTSWTIESVVINQNTAYNDPATDGHVDTWNGASWDNQKSWTGKGNENFTVTLDAPVTTTRFRIYGTAGSNPNLWALADTYSVGHVPTILPSVTTVAASGVLCTSVVLNGNLTDLGAATTITVGFHFGTSSTLIGAVNLTVGTTTSIGTFSKALSEISESTKFYFDAWANGDHGYAHGSILNFTTPACPTICGSDTYAPANLWSVGILAAVAVVLAGMASALHFRALWILSGIAILFISFYSVCMGGFIPAGLVVVIGIFAMLEGIPAREGK